MSEPMDRTPSSRVSNDVSPSAGVSVSVAAGSSTSVSGSPHAAMANSRQASRATSFSQRLLLSKLILIPPCLL
jgi:hypothetical protein